MKLNFERSVGRNGDALMPQIRNTDAKIQSVVEFTEKINGESIDISIVSCYNKSTTGSPVQGGMGISIRM